MPEIERVLNAGGTAALDFTLHDAEHSFRVAKWMAEIVGDDVLGKLSAYELALLLLSAYLHDIGMTPEQGRVQRHWRHLVFGPVPEEKEGLSPKEAEEFQRWLDDERGGLVPPLAQDGRPSEDELLRAAELITYYARHKHNDWSGEWIRQNTTGHLGSYEGWVEDLVRLCRSHHEDYEHLKEPQFDPRLAGRHGEVVHLRYLACVLRVADILDVDPERTPPVLFQHRGISPKSVLYWWKDHDFWVRPDGSTLMVHARPRSAVVEKAIRDTADWIRIELETCARLGRNTKFSYSPLQASEPLPHKWTFPESLLSDVSPRNDDYVYIDGAFRPDTTKLLELLSGIQLYKEPLAAVRELLQNAFDAVKEQIALERLEGDPSDSKRTDAITALQSVELRFEERDGRSWLLCTDSGVGMTRSIIEKYLLVSGRARRHDILELERRCEAAGFHLGRTGQFGIGVLSFFMLADRIEIRTRRSPARNEGEAHVWCFETEGVGSFGELRKDSEGKRGTTVSLRLRQDVVASRDEFLSSLQEYLFDALRRLPCSFRFVVEREAEPRLKLDTGWQPFESRLVDDYIRKTEDYYRARISGQKIPRSYFERNHLELTKWPAFAERFQSAIRWKTKSGLLPKGIGSYRLSVLFFELPGGRSGLFFDFDRKSGMATALPLVGELALTLDPRLRTSFRGMEVQSALAGKSIYQGSLSCFGEIDWEGFRAGQITVDRRTFSLTAEASEALSWLQSRSKELEAETLSEVPSDFAELNTTLNPLVPPPSEAWWFVNVPDQKGLRWERLSLPAVSGSSLNDLSNAVRAQGGGRIVSIAQPFNVNLGAENRDLDLEWGTGRFSSACPTRLAVVSTSPLVVIPEYSAQPRKANGAVGFFQCEFPPAWSSVAAFSSNWDREIWFLNRDHPLSRTIGQEDLEWFSCYSRNPADISEDLLQTSGRSALYLMRILPLRPSLYRELADDLRPGFWRELWDRLALNPAEIAAWIQQTDGMGFLGLFNPEGLEWIPATDHRFVQYLPDPGDEWKLTIEYRDGSVSGA